MSKSKFQCVAAKTADSDFIRAVAKTVFDAYPGGRKGWNLKDSPALWNIHSGERAKVLGVKLEGRSCCTKLFYDNRCHILLRNLLGKSKAKRAYLKGLKLSQVGLNCPEMIGYSVCRKTGLALLVTAIIDEACQVDHWLEKNGADEEVLFALGRFSVEMHDRGVLHKDFSPRNLLIDMSETGHIFTILDYEDLSFHAKVTAKQRIENLGHLYVRLMRTLPEDQLTPFLEGCGQEKL